MPSIAERSLPVGTVTFLFTVFVEGFLPEDSGNAGTASPLRRGNAQHYRIRHGRHLVVALRNHQTFILAIRPLRFSVAFALNTPEIVAGQQVTGVNLRFHRWRGSVR